MDEKSLKEKALEALAAAGNKYDSYMGAPTRSAIGAAKEGENPLSAFADQFGEDPSTAPTGFDLTKEIENPYLGAIAATAVDVVDPLSLTGVGAGVKALSKSGKALKGLGKTGKAVPTPEEIKRFKKILPSSPEDFRSYLDKSRNIDDQIKEFTHMYSPEEYSKMKTFLSADKKSGMAIKPDGDIVSAFSKVRGQNRLDDIMETASKEGGSKLDAFDGKLPELYRKKGFKEVRREPNWTPGEPDVVFMNRPKMSRADIAKEDVMNMRRPFFEDVFGKGASKQEVLKSMNNKRFSTLKNPKNALVENTLKYMDDVPAKTPSQLDRIDLSVMQDTLEKAKKAVAEGKMAQQEFEALAKSLGESMLKGN